MDKETSELWELLTEYDIATEDEILLVTSINGTTLDSLESILFCRTALRNIEQLREELHDF